MPTIEEIQNLPKEGWEKIGAMNDEELAVYLKDITILEPTIPEEATPNVSFEDKEKKSKAKSAITELEEEMAEENDSNPSNPFKRKEKKQVKFSGKGKTKLTPEEQDALMRNLLEGL